MNFYEAQDDARKKTKWLVLYFVLAVIGVVMALYSIYGIYMMSQSGYRYTSSGEHERFGGSFWDTGSFLTIAGIATGIILIGNVFKSLQLAGGGEAVARDVGGRPVDPHTRNLDEKKLINIVEEMSIASGVPTPQVWIMDNEPGINAFAAGTEPGNAVIGVTRGCVQQLTRAELQGVVAHEFSHILNGDMKMNMRLISWLFGIMMLSLLGQMLFQSLRFVRIRNNSKDNNSGGIVIALLAAGLALMVVGSIGVFFARMIQAAISRQREYLADASAVEFTRDPSGIAGALKKIGGQQYGSDIEHARASEASHMFFSDAGMFSYGFDTHPPLDERIGIIEKSWDGKFDKVSLRPVAHDQESSFQGGMAGVVGLSGSDKVAMEVKQQDWDAIGESSQQNLDVGRSIRAGLLDAWIDACHDREFAQALVFGLLLAEDDELREGEISFLEKTAGADAARLALQWSETLGGIHSSKKIALIDLSIPTLRSLTAPEYERFIEVTRWMIASDGSVNIFEFMLQKMVERHLASHFERTGNKRTKYDKLSKISYEVNVLLTTMAGIGANSRESVEQAYQQATQNLRAELGADVRLLAPEECGLKEVDEALEKVDLASPMVKKQLIHACGIAVMSDGILENNEAEMLRAVADSIGCSIPPFVKI